MSEPSFRIREIQTKKLPTKIGHYVIGEILGCGGYATVYKAVEIFTKIEVAVKVMDSSLFSEKQVGRLRREFEILQTLNHPNIVRIYEFLEHESKLYIFMELIQGKELFQLLSKKGPMSELFAAQILHQICLAVKYLHEQGIAHRDIKAQNIMVDPNFNIKLIDFGLAKKFNIEQKQLFSTFCGSPSYTAPEMLQKRKYQGKAVDIWCLAVTLYVMLQAALPFDQNGEAYRSQNIANIKWQKPVLSSPESQELYDKVFKPSKQRINIHQLLNCALFKKYHLHEKSYYKSWELQQFTNIQLNSENIGKIADWLKIDVNQVKMEILERKLSASFCLYQLLLQKGVKDTLSHSYELKPATRVQPHRKYTRSLHSQNQNHPTSRPQTPKKKQQQAQKMPLTIYKKYLASKEKEKASKQIKVTEPSSERQKVAKDSIGLRSKYKKANIFSKIVQIQFPKRKLRDDSPQSPKRILDYVKGYK